MISSVGRLNLESVQEQEEDQANGNEFQSHQVSREEPLPQIDVGISPSLPSSSPPQSSPNQYDEPLREQPVEEQSFSSVGR